MCVRHSLDLVLCPQRQQHLMASLSKFEVEGLLEAAADAHRSLGQRTRIAMLLHYLMRHILPMRSKH